MALSLIKQRAIMRTTFPYPQARTPQEHALCGMTAVNFLMPGLCAVARCETTEYLLSLIGFVEVVLSLRH